MGSNKNNNSENKDYNSKERNSILHIAYSGWIFSGKIITTLSLILLPLIVILSQLVYDSISSDFSKNFDDLESIYEKKLLQYTVTFFQYAVFATILFIYPPYPAPICIGNYFKKRGYENAVIEYEFVKKILYFAVPLFIILTIILPLVSPLIETYYSIGLRPIYSQPAFTLAQVYLLLIVLSGILKIIMAIARKRFRLYFARGCILIASHKKDEVEKTSYLLKALESYNSYLRRNLNLQISDLRLIKSKITGASILDKDRLIHNLSVSFTENDNITKKKVEDMSTSASDKEVDKLTAVTTTKKLTLQPLREIRRFVKPRVPMHKFLAQQPILQRVKDQSALAITIIPLIISVVELYDKIR
jgi:hypothetical protein